ncbi:MAG TPA: segregation/condensation protein A [Desulfuromonadales bacterium]|nr:segregation/condensation protein A [Desulfuromonadales bacterium]
MSYEIHLENFEGPLDLLLHLIKKNEMDIYNIPMTEITDQYLAIIDTMQTLNLDVAGEFLLMAATLIHIKSRTLLPQPEDDALEEEEEDPRVELVRRLLEYQKYKEAAISLTALPQLERDVFARPTSDDPHKSGEDEEFEDVGLYELVEALRRFIEDHPEAAVHEVDTERLSVTDRMNTILATLSGRSSAMLQELFSLPIDRHEVVVTFLAVLELVKLRLLRLMQNTRYGTIWLYPAVEEDDLEGLKLADESLGYN